MNLCLVVGREMAFAQAFRLPRCLTITACWYYKAVAPEKFWFSATLSVNEKAKMSRGIGWVVQW